MHARYSNHQDPAHRRSAQHGDTLGEFLPVAILLLLLGMGGIEIAHWMFTRQAVSLALLEAARAGITQHANPQAIADAFETALLPLYASSGNDAVRRLNARQQLLRTSTAGPPWMIEILQPDAQSFLSHGLAALPIARSTGRPAIHNDYQYEQHQLRADALQDNTIFQANTLSLRLTYLHKPLLPGIAALLGSIAADASGYGRHAMRNGLLPMTRYLQIGMESHPVDWPSLPDGRVVKAVRPHPAPAGAAQAPQACAGAWCIQALRPLPEYPAQAPDAAVDPPASGHPDTGAPPGPETPWPEDDGAVACDTDGN